MTEKVVGFTFNLIVNHNLRQAGFVTSDTHAARYADSPDWTVQKIYCRTTADVNTLMDEYRKKGYELRQRGFTMGKKEETK